MKKMKFWSMIMLTAMMLPFGGSCASNDSDEEKPLVVEVKDDGTTSNGSQCVIIDDKNLYLDYVKYTISEGDMVVSGYDKDGLKGLVNIVAKISYRGKVYEVVSIQDSAFRGCETLTSIIIPNSVTNIGHGAFDNCRNLESISIPNGVTKIENDVFAYCSSLTLITIPNSVETIGEEAFYYCSSLTSITIPNSVKNIKSYAFKRCSSLTSITIPNSVTKIEGGVFSHCSSLTSIIFSNNISSIETGTFMDCSSLTSITIPSNVTSMGGMAFRGCSNLTTIYCKAKTPPSIKLDNTFDSRTYENATMYVPQGSIDEYKSTYGWKLFHNIIEE